MILRLSLSAYGGVLLTGCLVSGQAVGDDGMEGVKVGQLQL